MKPLIQEANSFITAGNGTNIEGFREQDTLRRVLEGEERDKRLVVRRKQATLRHKILLNTRGTASIVFLVRCLFVKIR